MMRVCRQITNGVCTSWVNEGYGWIQESKWFHVHERFFALWLLFAFFEEVWALSFILVVFKCAFTAVISYGIVICSDMLSSDFIWLLPAKLTTSCFFFLRHPVFPVLPEVVQSDQWAVVIQRRSSVFSPGRIHTQSLKHTDMTHTTKLYMLTLSQDCVNL